MALDLISQLARKIVPARTECHRCGRSAANKHRQIWSRGEVFCSTRCCEAWHGSELFFD